MIKRLFRRFLKLFKEKPLPIEEQIHPGKILIRRNVFRGTVEYRQWVRPIRWNSKTVWIELPDKHRIKRHIKRDVIK